MKRALVSTTLLSIALGAGLAGFAAPAHGFLISHFIDCVEERPNGGLRAHFGYESSESSLAQIPVGDDNFFSPLPEDRGQPTVFFPGYHKQAFRIDFVPTVNNPTLAWNFLGNRIFVNTGVRRCPPPNLGRAVPAVLNVVAGGGQSTPRNTAFPQPIRVRLTVGGRPLAGARLRFATPTSGPGGSVAPPPGGFVTDAEGTAEVIVTAGASAGAWQLEAAFARSAPPPAPPPPAVTVISIPLSNL